MFNLIYLYVVLFNKRYGVLHQKCKYREQTLKIFKEIDLETL